MPPIRQPRHRGRPGGVRRSRRRSPPRESAMDRAVREAIAEMTARSEARQREYQQELQAQRPPPQQLDLPYTYCRNKAETEIAVRVFLNEPVLGFDAEWKFPGAVTDREKLSMIQLASETKVVLVHLALFPTPNAAGDLDTNLITGTLRTILQSANILKAGLNVNGYLTNDCSDASRDAVRLNKIYGITMRGLIELRDLHQSITTEAEHRQIMAGDYISLSQLNEVYCGRPLSKDQRNTDWSRSVDDAAKEYAAIDAIAGLRIYQEMEKRRVQLNPPVTRMTGDEVGFAFGAAIRSGNTLLRYRLT